MQDQPSESTALLPVANEESRSRYAFKDWIPAIFVGIIFLIITGLIFSRVGNNQTNIIVSNILTYDSNLQGIDMRCVGNKACFIEIQKAQRKSDKISLSYYVDSSHKTKLDLKIGQVGSRIYLFFNSTKISSDIRLGAHFKLFLPYQTPAGFQINFVANHGNIIVDKLFQSLGNINMNMDIGEIKIHVLLILIIENCNEKSRFINFCGRY